MKNQIYLCLVLTVLFLISCDKVDGNESNNENLIVGSWRLINGFSEYYENGLKVRESEVETDNYYEDYVFNSDESFFNAEYFIEQDGSIFSEDFSGIYYIDKNNLTLIFKAQGYEDEIFEMTYSMEGENLMLIDSEEWQESDGTRKKDVMTLTYKPF